ncbi:hypothetical protein BO70DRAFT_365739 [Aspergillus heteromorphus CBS 117.55]|uniref:Uncharacterized protein n=1 Tax=Aspergillus heteromorphus CBS 117.55 TaxID=1448321 RepID=A0A317V926_9EURO|nr:uncharacterized protein BO70DRAFT_365739 [Aspergillus heteromorphus CBS 117.55]PWY69801.1 hypothetical protein BO70DRAFT_365739 [Aspergillus heteromorphus CBS 117.55]
MPPVDVYPATAKGPTRDNDVTDKRVRAAQTIQVRPPSMAGPPCLELLTPNLLPEDIPWLSHATGATGARPFCIDFAMGRGKIVLQMAPVSLLILPIPGRQRS